MTNKIADYQRDFRERNRGKPRINTYIDSSAKASLERLAALYSLSQREVLERLLSHAEQITLEQFILREEVEQYENGELRKDVISNEMLSVHRDLSA